MNSFDRGFTLGELSLTHSVMSILDKEETDKFKISWLRRFLTTHEIEIRYQLFKQKTRPLNVQEQK